MLLMLVPTMAASLPRRLSHHLPAGGFPLSTVQHTRLLERALLSQSVLLFSLACYSAVCLSDCLSCVPTPSGPFTLSLSPSHCPSKSLALTLLCAWHVLLVAHLGRACRRYPTGHVLAFQLCVIHNFRNGEITGNK